MAVLSPDVIVYVCSHCIPQGDRLPRQWEQDGAAVLVRDIPCSGKMDAQYLLHALEGGGRGLCVVTCPKGECRLAQGNYRAEVRIRTLQRLLEEIGLEPERAELVSASSGQSFGDFQKSIHAAVGRICALGVSPLKA